MFLNDHWSKISKIHIIKKLLNIFFRNIFENFVKITSYNGGFSLIGFLSHCTCFAIRTDFLSLKDAFVFNFTFIPTKLHPRELGVSPILSKNFLSTFLCHCVKTLIVICFGILLANCQSSSQSYSLIFV